MYITILLMQKSLNNKQLIEYLRFYRAASLNKKLKLKKVLDHF